MIKKNNERIEKERVIICTIGEKATDFIPLVVNQVRPTFLYIICTEQQIDIVVSLMSLLKDVKYKLILVNDTNSEEISTKIFHTFNYLLTRFPRDHVFLNATSGSRLLCSLATAAACIFGVKSFYIVEENDKKIVEVSNPFEKFGLLLMQQATRFYSHHLYSASYQIFSEVNEKAGEIPLAFLAESLSLLSRAYLSWEKFVYKGKDGAYTLLKELSKKLNEIKRFIKYAEVIKQQVDRNIRFLGKLLGSTRGGKDVSPHLILDIFLNGVRRLEEERYAEAINRFYRCIEGSIQFRLIKYYSINPSNPNFELINNRKVKKFTKLIGKKSPPTKLSLFDGYLLLRKVLKDEFARKMPEKELKALMYSRNHSILSHGTHVMSFEVALKFQNKTEQIIKRLFNMEKLDFESMKEDASFLELDENEIYGAISSL